jgi:hypothetical protein
MPTAELCSECYLGRLRMMQQSPYSIFGSYNFFQDALNQAVTRCTLGGQSTNTQPPPIPPTTTATPFCLSNNHYTTAVGNTCDSIALQFGVSSAAIFSGNPNIGQCDDIVPGVVICLPLQCATYTMLATDDCVAITAATGLLEDDIRRFNPWIDFGCSNIKKATLTYGKILCKSPPGGEFTYEGDDTKTDPAHGEYADEIATPPAGATVAPGTTTRCGRWYKAKDGDNCATITTQNFIGVDLFRRVNPSLQGGVCSDHIVMGLTYCAGPTIDWNLQVGQITFNSFGCYSSALPNKTAIRGESFRHETLTTVSLCGAYCLYSNSLYTYFGIMNGNSCYCGSGLEMDTNQVAATQCSMTCVGGGAEKCGSPAEMSIYGAPTSLRYKYRSRGCYTDGTPRTLGPTTFTNAAMTVEMCLGLCVPTYKYFGVARGNECWCGDGIGSTGTNVSMTECSTHCAGDQDQFCGQTNRINIYSTVTATNTSTPNPDPPEDPYHYYGCYTEATSSRALALYAAFSGTAMTVKYCANFCLTTHGTTIFGVEYGSECYCGTKLEAGSVQVLEADCNVPCSGNATETCGAGNRLNVYGVSATPPLVYKPYGCYTEATSSRALALYTTASGTAMTIEYCADFCLITHGTAIFGIEYASECYCGNKLELGSVKVPNPDCNMPCSGNPAAYCGAGNRLSVYGTGATAPLAYKGYGCFSKGTGTGAHALPVVTSYASDAMTVGSCATFCLAGRTDAYYFSVENGRECYCGASLAEGSLPATAGSCNLSCMGAVGENCGGTTAGSLYGTTAAAPPILASDYTYQGCFTEATADRALNQGGSSLFFLCRCFPCRALL